MTTLAEQAQARARYQSAHGPQFGKNQCMWRCRELVGAPAIGDYDGDGSPDAEDGWKFAKVKHPTSNPAEIPGGVFVWWGGGSNDNGHVAFTDPDQRGMCWSTDIERTGYFDLVPIGLIHTRWGLPLLGWSEDIDGVPVYDPINQEDDMPLTDQDVEKVADAVWARVLKSADGNGAGRVLGFLYARQLGLAAAIDELAKGLDPAVQAAVKKAIADGVVDVDITVHDQTGD